MGWEKRPGWKYGLDEKTSGKDLQDDAGDGNSDVNHAEVRAIGLSERLRSEGCCEFFPALKPNWDCERFPCCKTSGLSTHSCEARVKGTAV